MAAVLDVNLALEELYEIKLPLVQKLRRKKLFENALSWTKEKEVPLVHMYLHVNMKVILVSYISTVTGKSSM